MARIVRQLVLAVLVLLPSLAAAAGGTSPIAHAFPGQTPEAGRPIEAENFDNGGPGVGYFVPAAVRTGLYRDTGIGIQPGGSNGYHVGHTVAGEWLAYSINIPSTGDYVFSATAACRKAGAQVHVSFDDIDLTGPIAVPKTADWFDWNTIVSHPFFLRAGIRMMRLHFDRNADDISSAGNFDTLFVTPVRPGISLKWRPAPAAPAPCFEGVGRVVRGKLYTFGGFTSVVPYGVSNRASVYDPATSKWTDLGVMPIPETHCGVAVDDERGRIWFVGGRRGTYPGSAVSEVWLYNVATNTWTRDNPLPGPLSAGVAEFLKGEIHYLGGNWGQDRVTDYHLHYVRRPGEASWRKAALLPSERDHPSAAAFGGRLYVFGGEVGHDGFHRQQTTTWAYDPATDAWRRLANMPVARSHAESSTFVLNNRIIVAGGQIDNFLATSKVLEYDPAADKWDILPDLPLPLEGVIVQPMGGRLFVTGGYVGFNSVATAASFSSNPFTGFPNSTAGYAAHNLVLPLAFGMMMTMSGLFAVLAAKRHRRTRQLDDTQV